MRNERERDTYQAPASLTNIEAEAAVLGALLSDNALLDDVGDLINPRDFSDPLHSRIFSAVQRMVARGVRADAITLRPILENDPDIEGAGGLEYLGDLVGSGMARFGIVDFARQIADLAQRRAVHKDLLAQAGKLVEDPDIDLSTVPESIAATTWDATAKTATIERRSAADAVTRSSVRAQEVHKSEKLVGVRSKFVSDLNAVLGPIEFGTMNILAGRPGQLKSTVAQSFALGAAANGHPTEYIHAEMTADQQDIRVAADICLANGTPIPHSQIRTGNLTVQQHAQLSAAAEAAAALPIGFHAVGRCNIRRVDSIIARSVARYEAEGRRLELVVLDYLQLFQIDQGGKMVIDKFQRVPMISEFIQGMAQRYNLAIIALAQVGRQVEDRKDQRPMPSDLRDSGDLEQDADTITFCFREETYMARERLPDKAGEKARDERQADMTAVKNKVELIGAKVRHGATRTETARFVPNSFAVRDGLYPNPDFSDAEPMLDLAAI